MDDANAPRLTPWVARLLLINAIVLLLQSTLFPGDWFVALFAFDPAHALVRPWTVVSYLFIHANILHLATNSMALFVFGPPVERRLGPSGFLGYYLFCGVGAAAVSYLLWLAWPQAILPFVGASGAILGVAFAFAKYLPDAEMLIFPLPIPIKAKNLVILFAAIDVVGAFLGTGNVAHVAHLGGMASGWLVFRLRNLGKEPEFPRIQALRTRPHVAVGSVTKQSVLSAREEAPPSPPVVDQMVVEKAEMNRVLDKISSSGMESLTLDERRFLDRVARRGRGTTH